VTRLLAERWPGADITGLDSSPAMLERARSVLPGVRFDQAGVEHWEPEEPLDLLFSNAALHWVGDHENLFPRLVDALFPGGVLAVQMPGNFDAPSHRLIRALAAPEWVERVGQARMGAVLGMADYHRLLPPVHPPEPVGDDLLAGYERAFAGSRLAAWHDAASLPGVPG
jgi:trans-aconitate 2-methyltransferase